MNDLNLRKATRALRRVAIGVTAVAIVFPLASCGGGDSDNGISTSVPIAASNTPPASASDSVDGFIAFLKVLVPMQPDTAQPLDVANFVAPTTETGTPDPSI